MVRREFRASDDELANITAFVEEQLESLGASMKVSMQIAVALEEIFVNIAHYAYPDGDGMMSLTVDSEGDSVSLRFADAGIPFDPLAKSDPDVTLSAEERNIGGLGIYMVKKTMDDVRYLYENGQNILIIVKKLR